MSQIIENKKLIFAEIDDNSYKVYNLELHDDGTVISRFGRVGGGSQECNYGNIGKRGFDKKLASKYKKGYVESKTIDAVTVSSGASVAKQDLATIALSQIKYSNPTLRNLITRLANANVHQITSSTNISYNETSGLFQTPLGVVTLDGITEARDLLGWFVKGDKLRKVDADFKQKLNQYLRLIPRKTSYKLKVEDIFPDLDAVQKESTVLDALESSYQVATSPKTTDDKTPVKPVEQVFNLKLDIFDDDSFSGSTRDFALNLLREAGIQVKEFRALVNRDALYTDFEILDARDFVQGTEYGGLVILDEKGNKIRVPYSLPYVNPSVRCSVTDAVAFSKAVEKANL